MSSPASYEDVKPVLNLALTTPGLRAKFSTPGKAIAFRHRCNRYRKLLHEMQAEQTFAVPGFRTESAYDNLVIQLIDNEGRASRKGCVLVFNHREAPTELFDAEGNPISVVPPTLRGD